MTVPADFRFAFLHALQTAATTGTPGTRDLVRFPWFAAPGSEVKTGVRDAIASALARQHQLLIGHASFGVLIAILERLDALEQTYSLLTDGESRRWMVDLLVYAVLGRRAVRLPLDTPAYAAMARRTDARDILKRARTHSAPGMRDALHYYELDAIGSPVHLHAHRLNVLNTFLLQQYRVDRQGVIVEPRAGDVVLDCGGCWGDTALWFADRVGPAGRVLTFEFLPANLAILRENLALNPELERRITVLPHAVWETSGETARFSEGSGPATSLLRPGAGDGAAETLSIDDLVARERLPRVDFVKMDIEGAELAALKGAAETLRRHTPRLAIAIYHQLDDWTAIPGFLRTIHPYRFVVDHFSTHAEETVLFAMP